MVMDFIYSTWNMFFCVMSVLMADFSCTWLFVRVTVELTEIIASTVFKLSLK